MMIKAEAQSATRDEGLLFVFLLYFVCFFFFPVNMAYMRARTPESPFFDLFLYLLRGRRLPSLLPLLFDLFEAADLLLHPLVFPR
jgi:hypothetical protein